MPKLRARPAHAHGMLILVERGGAGPSWPNARSAPGDAGMAVSKTTETLGKKGSVQLARLSMDYRSNTIPASLFIH